MPGLRSEYRSYLFRGESAPFEEAGLPDPLAAVGGHRLAEALATRSRRLFQPEPVVTLGGLLRRCAVDAAPTELLANPQRPLTAIEARTHVLLGESPVAEKSPRLQRIEHAFHLVPAGTARGELGRQLRAGVLAAREQLQGARPELRILLADQASTAPSGSLAELLGAGRSMSRSAVSMACATSAFCLRKSRTLSRPWPMRSPL